MRALFFVMVSLAVFCLPSCSQAGRATEGPDSAFLLPIVGANQFDKDAIKVFARLDESVLKQLDKRKAKIDVQMSSTISEQFEIVDADLMVGDMKSEQLAGEQPFFYSERPEGVSARFFLLIDLSPRIYTMAFYLRPRGGPYDVGNVVRLVSKDPDSFKVNALKPR